MTPQDPGSLLKLAGVYFRRDTPDLGSTAAVRASFTLHIPKFRLSPGERVAVLGPSGSGKSTFLDLLALLRQPTHVDGFWLAGVDVGRLWTRSSRALRTQLRARRIGYVLQTGGLLPYLDVQENLLLSQRLLGTMDLAWITRLVNTLGLSELRRRLPAQLSLGERQRVAVARALAHRPQLVLADEPTASLDARNADGVLDLLVSLCREYRAGLVLVSHDPGQVAQHGLTPIECRTVADGAVIER